jgi:5,10-methylenetetrahydromethanopterin reductase
MPPPFRLGVMQLTMEPLEEMLETANVMDDVGIDTIWLAEAYPWWRKHGMEARSSTVVSALMARETERLTIGWGIISPFTRHPVQVAMDARVVQEEAPERFLLGFGTSKIFLNNIKRGGDQVRPLQAMRDAVTIVRGVLEGGELDYEGAVFSASVPALRAEAESPRGTPPVYVAATAPKMQRLSGEIGDGLLTPSITTPAFVRYARENMLAGAREAGRDGEELDLGCTIIASIDETDRDRGRDGAREIGAMYLANKFQNIKGAADTLLDLAGIEMERLAPIADAMERGGRMAAKEQVGDDVLDRCKPIAGRPRDCIEAIEEYRDAGCTHIMLELWGERRHEQLRLFGEKVLPHVRA